MADERAFLLAIGRIPEPGFDYTTPEMAVVRYSPRLAYGSLLNPVTPHTFLASSEYPDGEAFEEVYSPDARIDEDYHAVSMSMSMNWGIGSGKGSLGWGPPPEFNTPWVCPEQVFASEMDDNRDAPLLLGIMPFYEMVLSYIHPRDCASGQQIAQNRWLFHAPNGGSFILRASDVPMTSLA
jgi:hypothetical protein